MLEKLQKLGCRFLIYDILQGTIEKIANKSPIFQVLNRNARFWILMKQEPSYVVHINENKTEQFERFVINIRWLRICTAVFFFFMKLRNFLSRFSFLFWGNVSYLWKFVTSFFSYFFNQSKGKLIKGKH